MVNKTVGMYLCCFTNEHPAKWMDWLFWVEYCYNTNYHSSLQTTPFDVVYGRSPPRLTSDIPGSSVIDAVDQGFMLEMQCWDPFVKIVKITTENEGSV